ncbi:MAG TPA: hypothetical protein VJ793_23450 [Anaerolineae bacterium]|nr:hypothetical protein [Anaerolineae bacterium]
MTYQCAACGEIVAPRADVTVIDSGVVLVCPICSGGAQGMLCKACGR